MRNRIERLRLWLLAGAVLLVLVLAVFIGSARYLRRHLVGRLPQKLGSNIKSETNNVTLSHTSKGGTVYKLRAKKEDELTDGKIAFMDAQIMLYGPKQNRADRIYGDEFQYDESAGLLRAIGLVHIDMQAAAAAGGKSAVDPFGPAEDKTAAKHGKEDSDAKVLHATTSGLVYMEKLSVAATSERVEFQLGEMSGHAIGADYSSDSDVLSLHSDVYVSGIANGRPLVLTAASAEINNRDHVTFLTHAKYVSEGKTVEADHATVHTRQDGTLERIETEGNVKSEARGERLTCARGDVLLNANGQPKSALLSGAVTYSADDPLRLRRGQADNAAITFDGQAQPQPEHAVFTGSVHMTERTRAAGAGAESEREPWSSNDLTASRVEMALVPARPDKVQPRDVEATGNAHLTVVNNGSLKNTKGAGKTELSADDLKAHFLEAKPGTAGRNAEKDRKVQPEIDTLAGRGHTLLHQVSADGTEQTSAGDILDAKFRSGALGSQSVGRPSVTNTAAGDEKARQAAEVLLSAMQQGHVHVIRHKPASSSGQHAASAKDDVEDAVAARAAYDGDTDRMTLTGGVQLTEAGSVIWASQIALDHKTGDARAEGAVKVDYVNTEGALAGGAAGRDGKTKRADAKEPAHILADRAELNHATSMGTFYGRPARMWQGGSQVQAPVLEFAKEQRKLFARSDASSNAGSSADVHTMLVSAGDEDAGAGKATTNKISADKSGASSRGTCKSGVGGAKAGGAAASGAGPRSQVVRIASHELVYSGLTRQADFSGGVKVQSADGTMLAREATVFLLVPKAGAGAGSASEDAAGFSMDGRIERVVASGKVEIEQLGLHAAGGGLTYTAADGVYLLTGDSAVLPKVTDAQGATTAAAFRFSSGDCGVEALSTVPGEKSAGQRVRTDTTVSDTKRSVRSR